MNKKLSTSKALLILVLLGTCLTAIFGAAQKGDNAVYNSSGSLTASPAWIDATTYCTGGGSGGCGGSSDVCTVINAVLLGTSLASGGVLDARGVVPLSTGGSQTCNVPNPFVSLSLTNAAPITVLLPASTIVMTGTWLLPDNVRLVGEGDLTILDDTAMAGTGGGCCVYNSVTKLGGAMIQMGPAPAPGSDCSSLSPSTYSGISIEHVKLQTKYAPGAYFGIDNECAQTSSYVNDVGMSNVYGTGIRVGPGAANSGPYTNLSITIPKGEGSGCGSDGASCVDLEAQTQGLHGLTCLGNDATDVIASTNPGVIVNASNNSLKDIHVESFWDAIAIGATSSDVSNIIVSNVLTSKSGGCGAGTENAVHICGPPITGSPFGACYSNGLFGSVQDVTVSGVSNLTPTGNVMGRTSIQDDQTDTTIQSCTSASCSVPITSGIYALGRINGGNTYSRFAINPASSLYGGDSSLVATWGVGATSVAGGTTCYTPGALYSDALATTGNSVYVCAFSTGSTYAWQLIPTL